eukprot:TRINITY_DN10069_c0_g1_i1.p1 TRINITY_DN10069_c0_g1~~TRINITY_DN10069_c0_g1_i1.p1  ORF type:complete len:846 (+),score=173.55 TRINITY_DN10069_c0_g1_i1:106-2643(+)
MSRYQNGGSHVGESAFDGGEGHDDRQSHGLKWLQFEKYGRLQQRQMAGILIWKKIVLGLKGKTLYFFKKVSSFEEDPPKPHAIVDLDSTSEISIVGLWSLRKLICFEILSGGKSYILTVDTEEERREWVTMLNQACTNHYDVNNDPAVDLLFPQLSQKPSQPTDLKLLLMTTDLDEYLAYEENLRTNPVEGLLVQKSHLDELPQILKEKNRFPPGRVGLLVQIDSFNVAPYYFDTPKCFSVDPIPLLRDHIVTNFLGELPSGCAFVLKVSDSNDTGEDLDNSDSRGLKRSPTSFRKKKTKSSPLIHKILKSETRLHPDLKADETPTTSGTAGKMVDYLIGVNFTGSTLSSLRSALLEVRRHNSQSSPDEKITLLVFKGWDPSKLGAHSTDQDFASELIAKEIFQAWYSYLYPPSSSSPSSSFVCTRRAQISYLILGAWKRTLVRDFKDKLVSETDTSPLPAAPSSSLPMSTSSSPSTSNNSKTPPGNKQGLYSAWQMRELARLSSGKEGRELQFAAIRALFEVLSTRGADRIEEEWLGVLRMRAKDLINRENITLAVQLVELRRVPVPLLPILPDQVECLSTIAKGGFGEISRGVYRKKNVALKKAFNPHSLDILREMTFLGLLQHPNLLKCYGGSLEAEGLIVMELAHQNLREFLHNQAESKCPFDWEQILEFSSEIANVLKYLHSLDIIHRDLKSANLMVMTRPNVNDKCPRIKLIDFGISRVRSSSSDMTKAAGTVAWMAPEVIIGSKYDAKADIYSFAIVAWELASRELPFHQYQKGDYALGNEITKSFARPVIPSYTPGAYTALIKQCWEHDSLKRPDSSSLVSTLKAIKNKLLLNDRSY